jgi:hypothetical protein
MNCYYFQNYYKLKITKFVKLRFNYQIIFLLIIIEFYLFNKKNFVGIY